MSDQTTEDATDPIAAFMASDGAALLDRLNGDFDDSVLLIGRVLGQRPAATTAQATAIDATAVTLELTDDEGTHRARVPFARALTDPMAITTELFDLVLVARERSGEEGTTTAERVLAEATGYRTFLTEVVATRDLHPHLREITFGGGDLATFTPAGPDTFLYLLLPPPGRTELTIDQGFRWETVGEMAPEDQPVGAYYTLRRWRPEVAELDVLVVLHDDVGPASGWAATAAPGDPVALWGPRTAYAPPAGTDRFVLVADETGLPAVAAILESLPAGTPAQVFAEVDSAAERQELPDRPDVDVTWLHRDGAAPGTTTLLADAVRAATWPDGTPYVWGSGESRTMAAVRRYVRQERGLDRDAVSLVAYWRHRDHALDADDD